MTPYPTRNPLTAPAHDARRRVARFFAACWCALALVAVIPAGAVAVYGDHFGFAEVDHTATGTSAPAFAPAAQAFWAGVCDLNDGPAGIGARPVDPFAACIDHSAGAQDSSSGSDPILETDSALAPLYPGAVPGDSGPDGWHGLVPSWRLADVTQAGAHPDGSTSFWFARHPYQGRGDGTGASGGWPAPEGAPRNVTVSLPPGVIGNPNAVPKCQSADLQVTPPRCPSNTQVGVSTILLNGYLFVYPVYNAEPRDGKTAELLIGGAGLGTVYTSNVSVVAKARTNGDFGVDAMAIQIPPALAVNSQTFTIWGVPWAASHDRYRPIPGYCGPPGPRESYGMAAIGLTGGVGGGSGKVCSQQPQSYDQDWGPIRPFLTTQTECSEQNPVTRIVADNWNTDVVANAESVVPTLTGCEDVDFDASFGLDATSDQADGASGLEVDLSVAQNEDAPPGLRSNPSDTTGAPAFWESTAGLATSHLKDSVVTLPEGVSVNPSAATGLEGCADGEVGVRDASTNPPLFNDSDPLDNDASDGVECPAGSVIGTAEVTTPLLDGKLSGHVVLGAPKSTDPQSGEMFRMFLVVRNQKRGLLVKVYGTAVADPATGRLTATFENNPRVPFSNLKLAFKGGDRGLLGLPQRCATHQWSSTFEPWSGGAASSPSGTFAVNASCGLGFAPTLSAGMDSQQARSNGSFSFKFARSQGQQYLRGLTAVLPKGLLASVKDVPLCSNAAADAGTCPAGSKIGIVDAKAGSGDPFVLEEKGEVFLTEGYKGGEYGLAVKVRPVAGPFRGAMELSPIVVRQAIHVDRTSAQVTAVSDPFPLIHHGVPLRVREVTVLVNRDGFMLNPSDCSGKQVGADLLSDQGTTSGQANPFHTAGCAGLAFKPKLTLALTGRKQTRTGKHPGIRAQVNQNGIPEAGIEKAVVRLPKSLALDVNNAQALCEFVDGIKPDLENHCPKGSIVGRARAVSPLLNDPLVGNVYFVKNIRIDPKTGNQIRTLPMIMVALRGEVNVNLKGESDTQKGKLVNTFNNVPDAPISQFNLNINGGKTGIIAVTRTRRSLINLCASGRQVAEADMDGQNGRRHDFDVRMKTPCRKKKRS